MSAMTNSNFQNVKKRTKKIKIEKFFKDKMNIRLR